MLHYIHNAYSTVMYSLYLRERIVRLSKSLHGNELVNALQEAGFRVSRSGVYYVLKKYRKSGTLFDYPRCGRPKVLSQRIHQRIDYWLHDNNELTTNDLLFKLHDEEGLTASRSSVARARQRMGSTGRATRYCQLIREANKSKRVEFCQKLLDTHESFDDVVFTDESMIQLKPAHRKVYHKTGEPRRFRPTPKHPVKVYIWGGISKRGATNVVIFEGTMDGPRYTRILTAGLLPFVRRKFPDGNFRFQQDNDPKHTSRIAKAFLEDEGINWWHTPAESPDLNPIERVWSHLKQFLTYVVKPHNKQELIDGIKLFWRTKLTVRQCTRYIDHIHRVVPLVIAKNGEAVVDDELPRPRGQL